MPYLTQEEIDSGILDKFKQYDPEEVKKQHELAWNNSPGYQDLFEGKEQYEPGKVKLPSGVVPDRGFVGDVASNLARGAGDLTRMGGYALKTIDPDGGIDILEKAGQKMIDVTDYAEKNLDIMKQDQSEAAGEGLLSRGWKGGVRSAVPSVSPVVAGGLAGSVFGPVGALVGAGIGTLGLFGFGVYGEKRQEYIDQGIEEPDAEKAAFKQALIEGGIETAGSLIGLKIFGVDKFITQPLKQSLKELIETPLSTWGKKLATDTFLNEIPTEMLQEALGSQVETGLGLQDEGAWREAMVEAIVPAMVMSLGFGLGSQGLTMVNKRNLKNQINNLDDPKARLKAVEAIEKGILAHEKKGDDTGISNNAEAWSAMAMDRIEEGKPIELNTDFVTYATNGEDVLSAMRGKVGEGMSLEYRDKLTKRINNLSLFRSLTPRQKELREQYLIELANVDKEIASQQQNKTKITDTAQQSQQNIIGPESDQFEQFQEGFRDQKIGEFEQNLKQAQDDIAEYPDRPPIQPDIESLRKEWEDRKVQAEANAPATSRRQLIADESNTFDDFLYNIQSDTFENNLRSAQAAIQQQPQQAPIQPDVEALRREYENKQAPGETESKLSRPQGMLYSQQQQPVVGQMPDSRQQEAKPELEPTTGMGLKDKGQQSFVDQRIQKLGSIDAVDKAYGRNDNVSQYARAKAREVFGHDVPVETVTPVEEAQADTEIIEPVESKIIQSKGHIGFFTRPGTKEQVEVYNDANGAVYTAPVSNVIDVDTGYRIGRFEAPSHLADQAVKNLLNNTPNASEPSAPMGVTPPTIKENLSVAPGQSVTWKDKKGKVLSGKVVKKQSDTGSAWQVIKPDGKKTFVHEKYLRPVDATANNQQVQEQGAVYESGSYQVDRGSQSKKNEPQSDLPSTGEPQTLAKDDIPSNTLKKAQKEAKREDSTRLVYQHPNHKHWIVSSRGPGETYPGKIYSVMPNGSVDIWRDGIEKSLEPEQEAETTEKQPWKMNLLEYGKSKLPASQAGQITDSKHVKSFSAQHRNEVKTAIDRGERVPKSVLEDHPDLARQYDDQVAKWEMIKSTGMDWVRYVPVEKSSDNDTTAIHESSQPVQTVTNKVMPKSDSNLETIDELSDRIESIDRQISKLENIDNQSDFDEKNAKIAKLNARKDSLWGKRSSLLSEKKQDNTIEKFESDLSRKGTGSIQSDSGRIDYSIQAKDDGNGFYFQYVEAGARYTKGGAGSNRWSQQEAIDRAVADAKGRAVDPAKKEAKTDYGAKNKVFTAEAADRARELLRKKLSGNQLNSGIDPEVLLAGIQLGGYHIEAGARTFSAYSKAMIQDVGDSVKPYLRSFYEGVRHFPGFDSSGMTESNVLDNETDAIENEVTPTSTPEPTATIEEVNDDRSQEDDERPGIQNLDQEDGETVPGGRDGVLAGNVEHETTEYDNVLGISSPEDVRGPEKPGSVEGDGIRPGMQDDGGVGRTDGIRDEQFGREAASGTGLDDNEPGGVGRTGGTGIPGEPDRVLENYHIEDPEALIGGTPKVRFKKNQKAIEVFNEVSNEGRRPTAEERDAMAAYIGWGSFGQELFQGTFENPTYKDGWAKEGEWLRSHLGKSAWESAQASIINAHYTDPPTVSAIWDIVKQLGFNGGRVLEPSMGIGNFLGLMPKGLKSNSDLTGIELDETTAGMAKMLYPEANIQQMGYQDSKTADGFYDIVLGNWPFAAQGPADRRYNKYHLTLHDYFFIKALDQVREGGLVVGITASGTMDKVGKMARLQMGKRADLVAAFRMPTGAFQKYAGTSVVADVIILQKRAEGATANHDAAWLENTVLGKAADGKEIKVNEYWIHKPENVLGNMTIGHGTTQGREGMIVERQQGYEDVLSSLTDRLPKNIITKRGQIDHVNYITNNTTERQNSVTIKDNGLYIVRGERLARLNDELKYSVKDEKETEAREAELKSLVRIRDRYGKLLDAERNGEKTAENHRAILNQLYKAFVKKYGNLNGSFALKHFARAEDPMAPAMAALEKNTGAKENPVYEPAKIFTASTQRKKAEIKNPSISDAFVMTRNEVARVVDIESIAEKAGTTPEAVKAELIKKDAIFETPAGTFEVKDIYLSGNVREKLREAKAAKEDGLDMDRNIKALEAVIPDDIPYFNIEATMGAAWIPAETYKQFITDTANLPDANGIHITPSNNGWIVKFDDAGMIDGRQEVKTIWSTPGASFTKILRSAFTGQTITIKTKDEDGNEYVDKEMSTAANEKVGALREALKDWIWKDVDRRVALEQHYNETMNAWATPAYDGSFLSFDGMMLQKGESEFNLRKHQVNAIWRGVANGRGLYAHEVGTGKAQPLDSKILTPHGWKLMGDIHVNDQVITQNGAPTNVEAVFPQGEKDIYRVLFSDGSCTECCEEHLWLTQTYRERNQTINAIRFGKDWDCAKPKIRSLSEIKETLVSPHLRAKNHSIPTVEPVLFESQDVQLDPYLMGVLLGDGNMSHRSVTITSKDNEIINHLVLPENVELRRCESKGRCPTWGLRIIKQQGFGSNKESNPVVYSLESLGLMGKRSDSKFIPNDYLFNNIQNRISLLQGLMDTDGYVSKTGHSVYFYTVSSRLANDVVSLVQSLGGVVNRTIKNPTYSHNGENRKGKECHVLCVKMPPSINPFKMERKASLVKPKEKYGPVRYIVDVKYVGKKQAQCIRVSDPSHLYVTDDFIVTHNTFTMGGIAVESRRYGLAKKPLILAHNANSASVAYDIQNMYPGAKVLYIDNLTPKTIDQKLYQIANDEWDAVVLPHSLLDRLTLSRETLDRLAQDEIMSLEEEAIASAAEEGFDIEKILDDEEALRKIRGATTAKEMVKQRNRIIQNIEKQAQAASREGAIPFESLGLDMLIVDEVHEFKKPPLSTKMKVKGLNTTASGRSIGLNFLASYIKEQNNGKGVHIFTGTPITNTLNEIYNHMRYVMSREMEKADVLSWDSWFNTFASVESDIERTSSGEYEMVSRLSGFHNVSELRKFAGQYMDIVFAEDMPEFVPRKTQSGKDLHSKNLTDAERDELVNGRVDEGSPSGRPYKKLVNEVADMSEEQRGILQTLVARAKSFKDASGKERREIMLSGDPRNPVVIETDAAKAGFDPRLYDKELSDHPRNKINRCVNNVLKHYHEHEKACQVIFMEKGYNDQATRSKRDGAGEKATFKVDTFNASKDLKNKLIEGGIPAEQIAIVNGSVAKKKRLEISNKVNSGEVRVVIGLTSTLGTGTNMQENLRAMHHLDAPWMPGELEQRNGRGHRQGNRWNTVLEYRYITESIDARRWQVLAKKQKMITDFLKAKEGVRSIEGDSVDLGSSDLDEINSSFSEAAGDARILIREKLKKDIEKLERKERTHSQGIVDAKNRIKDIEGRRLPNLKDKVNGLKSDIEHYQSASKEPWAITIDGKKYTKRQEANVALEKLSLKLSTRDMRLSEKKKIGSYRGFDIIVSGSVGNGNTYYMERDLSYPIKPSTGSIDFLTRSFPSMLDNTMVQVAEETSALDKFKQVAKEPFAQEKALQSKKESLVQLERDLESNPDAPPSWLAQGAPVGTDVYYKGEPWEVDGHRKGEHGHYVIIKQGENQEVVDYLEVMDENNLPVYETLDGDSGAKYSTSSDIAKPENGSRLNTETDAFLKWFGDSQVVDDDGKPLVVYHGTDNAIAVFKKKYLGQHTEQGKAQRIAKIGFWFNEKPMAMRELSRQSAGTSYKADMPVFLSINEPFYTSLPDLFDYAEKKKDIDQLIRDIKDNGHDGLIVRDTEFGGNSYVAFRSNQIKSIYNTGTWDGSNPDIRYATAKHQDQDISQIDKAPGQGLTTQDIQSHFPGQSVSISTDNSISIRFTNGKWCRIKSVDHIGGDDIRYAMETGRMSEGGVILGKYQDQTITLNKNLANAETLTHETLHLLKDMGVLTPADLMSLDAHREKLARDGKYRYEVLNNKEENHANTLAQLISDREAYRNKSALNRIIQKIMDFWDGLIYIGRQSAIKLAREYESGKIYSRDTNDKSESTPRFQTAGNTNSDAFKKWFGKSVGKTKDGKPVVFYHGTPNQFTVFEDRSGQSTTHTTSGLGHFFTMDNAYANAYSKETGNVMQVYLKMEKPYRMSLDEAQSFNTITDAVVKKRRLKLKGYDSVIITVPGSTPMIVVFNPNQIKSVANQGAWSHDNPDIRYSTFADAVSIKENESAYKQIASGLKNVLSNHKNKGKGYKPDIGVIENTLGLMSHYSEKIPAMKRTFDELMKRPEWKFEKENELSKNGEESMIGTLDDLKKNNKVSYDILKDYLIDNDINQIGAVIFQAEDGTWTIKSEKDEKGKRKVLEEGIATKHEARALVIEYEVDAYPDPSGSDALRAFRTMTSNLHDFYAESWEAIIKDYEDRGLTLPQVVTKTKSGDVRIDLKVALAQMGDRSSYYFPRQRSNGDWQVYGKKQGRNDFVDYRDNKVTADYLAGKMKAQGYDVEVKKIGSMSEDVYQSVKNILATQAMVNQALNETKLDAKQRTLEDIGLSGEWRGQDYFIPNGGVYEWSSSVLKDLGGMEYSDRGKDGRSWSPGYWFEKAPKDIEELVTNALYISRGQETDISFEISQSLANQLSDTLRARGSRARMIARSDAVGKDVPIGYETDPVSAIAQAVNAAAGGYAKQQVAMNTSKAITGQHYTWEEWQKQHQDYDALVNAEDELSALTKNSETEEERIADIDREIKDLHREGAGVATESEKARQDRLLRIGKLFREKEKIRKWEDDKQAAKLHQDIARLRSNIHKEYRAYIQDNMLDPKKQKRAYDDAVNAVENVLKNDEAGDRVINTLKGLTSVWFLGGRLSSAAINLTSMGTTVPAAMDAYGGIPLQKTMKHIVKAGKAYASFVTGKGNVSQEDRLILEDIFSRGWVAAQLNMETVNALKSGPAKKYGRAVELLMIPFKLTEEFNRGTTILAAYKGIMAENPGMSREDALLKAKKVSDRAHGIYGVENQPALLRKGRGLRAASAMYIFQTYMHNYLTTLAYMIGRKQAKAATYMILSPMVFGGAASSLLMPALKMIFKALDEDDPEEKIYQIAEELFGETGGDIARYGLPGLAGVSFKGSLAPNMPDFQEPLDALGPIGGMMRNIYDGAVNITQGDYLKGVEKISPLAIGNVAKAYRESTQGVTTRAGDPVFFGNKQIKGDFGTGLMRAAGMNPTKISKPREVQWHETELKQQYAERKRNIYSRIIRYHAQPGSEKNPDEWKEIIMEIKEFNARVKSNGFNDVMPLITHKTIKARVKRAFRPNKRERLRDDM